MATRHHPLARQAARGPRKAGGGKLSVALFLGALLLVACRRDTKKPVRIVPLEGESAVLPMAAIQPQSAASLPEHLHVTAAGKPRTFLLIPPPVAVPGRSYPLVLVFHGDGGTADSLHGAWAFERGSGAGAFVVYLDGRGATWDLETLNDNADLAFVDAVVKTLEAEFPIDPTHVFATGYSSGGFFANVLACHRPGLLRAIASNAGGAPYNQATTWSNGFPKCPGQEPVAMLALHGEQDYGVTLDSGRFSAEYWAYVDGCTTDEMEPTGYAECRAYRGCKPGKAVAFCAIPSLGHWVWDHAAEATWAFFMRQ